MDDHIKKQLRCFTEHGYRAIKESGAKEVFGNCIFCSKKDKFYINFESKQWNCKRCNKSGGFQTWLKEVAKYCQDNFDDVHAKKLAEDRYVSISTLKQAGVGWNPWTNKYTLPVPMMDGGGLGDLRRFNLRGRLWGTSDCKTGLFGWEFLKSGFTKIHLTEGEWDGLAMREALSMAGIIDEIVLSVPGINVFKQEWINLFQGMDVDVLYDNDDPGRDGCVKVFNSLQGIVHDMKFLHWKPNEKNGKDIRDLYKFLKRKPTAFFKRLRMSLYPEPQNYDKANIQITGITTRFKFTGENVKPQEVYDVYNKWLLLKDNDVLDILYGVMIANRLPGDPVWLLLVAQSGSTKSELIMSLDRVINAVSRDSITANTLISGMSIAGGGDPSLIPRLNGCMFLLKDFTLIMEMHENIKKEIISQLRNAYDGKASKELGNNVLRTYESVFGMIAGVTPKIDIYARNETAIGERFLRWRIPEPETLENEADIARRSLHNTLHKKKLRKELSEMGKRVLDFDYKTVPTVSKNIEDKIISLAQWTAMLRGTIERDRYTKEATELPMKELPTRLTNQFYKSVLGMGMFHNKKEVTFEEFRKVKHLSISTIPLKTRRFIEIMYTKGIEKGWTIGEIENYLYLPYNTCERIADDLRLLGAVRKINPNKARPEWVLSKKSKILMEGTQLWQ